LQRKYANLTTIIPPGQAALVQAWDTVGLFFTPTGQLSNRFEFDDTLKLDGSMKIGLQEWQVHSAGGHDLHAVIFFEPIKRVLTSGDALWENGFGVVFPELESIAAFEDVASTFDLIEQLDPSIVIPGHSADFSVFT
jgi:glyoxylase-like metal-dependent hydrolase (beta-lactamase superfamily II)